MIMNLRVLIPALLASVMPCCQSISDTAKSSSSRTGAVSAEKAKHGAGKLGHGIIADHYDRDGDGRYEECRRQYGEGRGSILYFDRNGDGIADIQVTSVDQGEFVTWDENFDGVMDWTSFHNIGCFGSRWNEPQRVHERASRVFSEDHIVRVERLPLSEPHYPGFPDTRTFDH